MCVSDSPSWNKTNSPISLMRGRRQSTHNGEREGERERGGEREGERGREREREREAAAVDTNTSKHTDHDVHFELFHIVL